MLTIYSDDHHLHHGRCELIDGQLLPCFEMPSRADHILQRVKNRELGPVQGPHDFGRDPIQRIHSEAYLNFFQGALTHVFVVMAAQQVIEHAFAQGAVTVIHALQFKGIEDRF